MKSYEIPNFLGHNRTRWPVDNFRCVIMYDVFNSTTNIPDCMASTDYLNALYQVNRLYRVIHKSVKHFKNSQQIDYATDHGNSYVDRERNC